MQVKNLMVRDVTTVQMNASAYDAVKLMNEKRIGCLVVVHNKEIAGILTERDLLERVLGNCKDPKETLVSGIMTRQVKVGKPDMQLVEAAKLMFENHIKKLPIVDGKRLVGLVTLTDIARVASADRKTIEIVEALANMHMV